MKKIFFTLAFITIVISLYSQNKLNYDKFIYICYGDMDEFKKEYPITSYNFEDKKYPVLENGRGCPILLKYVSEKKYYIGGELENMNNGKKTIIKDIVLKAHDKDSAKFTVIGKDFKNELTLENGFILYIDEKYTIFKTKGECIWKISKKK